MRVKSTVRLRNLCLGFACRVIYRGFYGLPLLLARDPVSDNLLVFPSFVLICKGIACHKTPVDMECYLSASVENILEDYLDGHKLTDVWNFLYFFMYVLRCCNLFDLKPKLSRIPSNIEYKFDWLFRKVLKDVSLWKERLAHV